jgi:sodium/potassium-transporting ATPase subunit alpha
MSFGYLQNHLESKNLAFYSTNVVEGRGRGVVIKTGDETGMFSYSSAFSSPLLLHSSYSSDGLYRGTGGNSGPWADPDQQGDQEVRPSGILSLISSIRLLYIISQITAIAVTIGLIFLIISLAMDYTWIEAVVFVIGIIVANVPEVRTLPHLLLLILHLHRASSSQ